MGFTNPYIFLALQVLPVSKWFNMHNMRKNVIIDMSNKIESIHLLFTFAMRKKNPYVFLNVSIGRNPIERIVVEPLLMLSLR